MSSTGKGTYTGLKRQIQSARNNTLTFFIKLGPFYNSYIDRYNAALSVAQNNSSIQFVDKAFYYGINTVIVIRALRYIYKQKAKLDAKSEQAQNSNYVRSVYTSVFTTTIGMDCSYRLEGVNVVIPNTYDTFQYILGALVGELATRVLEATVRFRKRSARQARLYTANTRASTLQRKPTLIERLNPNERNATPLVTAGRPNTLDLTDDTQLARRNSEPLRLI